MGKNCHRPKDKVWTSLLGITISGKVLSSFLGDSRQKEKNRISSRCNFTKSVTLYLYLCSCQVWQMESRILTTFRFLVASCNFLSWFIVSPKCAEQYRAISSLWWCSVLYITSLVLHSIFLYAFCCPHLYACINADGLFLVVKTILVISCQGVVWFLIKHLLFPTREKNLFHCKHTEKFWMDFFSKKFANLQYILWAPLVEYIKTILHLV